MLGCTLNTWTFIGVDGKKCFFGSDTIKFFMPPVDRDGWIAAAFSKEDRSVTIWKHPEWPGVVNVDVYHFGVLGLEEAEKFASEKPNLTYEYEGNWPDSNAILEIGKRFIQGELTETVTIWEKKFVLVNEDKHLLN